MTRLLIILIIIFGLWLLWPRIRRPITRWALGRLQKRAFRFMRDAAGMPPEEDSGKTKKKREKGGRDRQRAQTRRYRRSGPLIPKEYAVDVEYVEIHDYSSTTVIGEDPVTGRKEEWHESQVTDAEWVEIRDSHK